MDVLIYIAFIFVIIMFSVVIMSEMQAYEESIYDKLGGMKSMLLPITHLGFFVYILSRKYKVDIERKEIVRKCEMLFFIEIAFVLFIIGDFVVW